MPSSTAATAASNPSDPGARDTTKPQTVVVEYIKSSRRVADLSTAAKDANNPGIWEYHIKWHEFPEVDEGWVSQGAVERGCPKLLKSFWWAVACPEGPPSRADPKFQEAFEAPEPWRKLQTRRVCRELTMGVPRETCRYTPRAEWPPKAAKASPATSIISSPLANGQQKVDRGNSLSGTKRTAVDVKSPMGQKQQQNDENIKPPMNPNVKLKTGPYGGAAYYEATAQKREYGSSDMVSSSKRAKSHKATEPVPPAITAKEGLKGATTLFSAKAGPPGPLKEKNLNPGAKEQAQNDRSVTQGSSTKPSIPTKLRPTGGIPPARRPEN